MNDKIFSVYMHKNKINGKVYIGATSQKPETRWNKGLGYKTQKSFYDDILKYGWDNFEHIVIIDNLDQEQSQVLERFYIKKYKDNCYNKTVGGEQRQIKPRNNIKNGIEITKSGSKYNKSYYERNREKIIQRVMKHKKENEEKYNEYQRNYYQQNQKYHDYKVQYQREYRARMKALKVEP